MQLGYASSSLRFPVFFTIRFEVLQAFCLFAALLIYGAYGSPTPDGFGVVEVTVGALLIAAAGISGLAGVFEFRDRPLWFGAGQVLLSFGLVFGVLNGLVQGQDVAAMVRDVIPFLFLFLPLFFWPLMKVGIAARGPAVKPQDDSRIILMGVLAVGVLFSLRVVFGLDAEALYYLGNSPCVLFAVLFGIGMAFSTLSERLSVRSFAIAAGFLLLAGLCVMPLALSLQRASLGAVALYSILAMGLIFLKAPRRSFVIVAVTIGALWSVSWFFAPVLADLQSKTSVVGINMRIEEWQAVWEAIRGSGLQVLFGNGWGAGLQSPAVADIRVNFTHSLLSAMLLKIGVVGVLCTGFYLLALARWVMGGFSVVPFVVLALAAPILIDVFLYAAYKSLDFGLMLVLCVVYGNLAFRRAV